MGYTPPPLAQTNVPSCHVPKIRINLINHISISCFHWHYAPQATKNGMTAGCIQHKARQQQSKHNSNIRYFVLPSLSSVCQRESATVAGRFTQLSQEPSGGRVNTFFSQNKKGVNNPVLGNTGY